MVIASLIKRDFETTTPYLGTHSVKDAIIERGAVVVMEEGAFLGVLTPDDILKKPHNLIIDCLSLKPKIESSHTFSYVLDLMKTNRVKVLPAYEKDDFLGLVYFDDIIGHMSAIIDEQKFMVQTVAHDLKNPINSILGLTSLLRSNINKEENIELLDYADQACNYASEIIADLLLIPQLEGEQDEKSEYQRTEMNALIRECTGGLKVLARAKEIQIVEIVEPEDYFFSCHRSKFKRAVSNIISNAIKFTPSKGTITVATTLQGSELLIKITDSGIGIPLSNQPYIFNKFTKAKRAGTDGEKSFGIGLFITKQIIENHKGSLWLESGENKGSTFFIQIGQA